MTLLMRLLILGRGRVGHAVIDARRHLSGVCGRWYLVILHRFFIAFLVLWSIMMVEVVLLLILLSGLLVLIPKRRRLAHAVRDRAFLPGPLVFGIRNGFEFLLLPSVLRTLLIGPILLVSWLSGSPFWVVLTVLLVIWILGLVAFPLWNCSFFVSFGLVRGSP